MTIEGHCKEAGKGRPALSPGRGRGLGDPVAGLCYAHHSKSTLGLLFSPPTTSQCCPGENPHQMGSSTHLRNPVNIAVNAQIPRALKPESPAHFYMLHIDRHGGNAETPQGASLIPKPLWSKCCGAGAAPSSGDTGKVEPVTRLREREAQWGRPVVHT